LDGDRLGCLRSILLSEPGERRSIALQPAGFGDSPAALWTPVLNLDVGYCEYECNLCGQVCPTGAIRPLSVEQRKQTKIGQASIDRNRCLPYAYGLSCIVCEEHCPIPNKAIWFEEREILRRDGIMATVKQPRIDATRCVGCGVCQNKCPVSVAAVRVTSVGESRNPANQMLLAGF
jgi:ferredoxin